MLSSLLLLSLANSPTAQAGAPMPLEDLEAYSEVIIEGEVIETSCLNFSVTTHDSWGPILEQSYESVISINDLVRGDVGESLVVVTGHTTVTEESDTMTAACSWEPAPHPQGEVARYYLMSAGDDTWTDMDWGQIIEDDTSLPQDLPSCGEDEYDIAVEIWLGDNDETGDDDDDPTIEDDETIDSDADADDDPPAGCHTANANPLGGFALLLGLVGLGRRRR